MSSSQSVCFARLAAERPDVYQEAVNRQNIPTSLLVSQALRKHGLEYQNQLSLEENCLRLLSKLNISLTADMQKELKKIVGVAPKKRPQMTEPDFLVPIALVQPLPQHSSAQPTRRRLRRLASTSDDVEDADKAKSQGRKVGQMQDDDM